MRWAVGLLIGLLALFGLFRLGAGCRPGSDDVFGGIPVVHVTQVVIPDGVVLRGEQGVIVEVRFLAEGTVPPTLTDHGLRFTWEGSDVSAQYGVVCTSPVPDPLPQQGSIVYEVEVSPTARLGRVEVGPWLEGRTLGGTVWRAAVEAGTRELLVGELARVLRDPEHDPNGWFGFGMAAGDVDGDGYGDIAISSLGADGGGILGAGAVHVFHGPDQSRVVSLHQPRQPEWMADFGGASRDGLVMADVDGDGFQDVVAGAPHASKGGRVFVLFGPTLARYVELHYPEYPDSQAGGGQFGASIHASDLDGDGKADVVVGCPTWVPDWSVWPPSIVGRVVVFAGADLKSGRVIYCPFPDRRNSYFGQNVYGGDFDGDRKGEILVNADGIGGSDEEGYGTVFVYSFEDLSLERTLERPEPVPLPGVWFGGGMASGDLNADSYPDLVVQETPWFLPSEGRVVIFWGPTLEEYRIIPSPGGQFSLDTSLADINRDGHTDLLVGGELLDEPGPVGIHVLLGPDFRLLGTLTPPGPKEPAWFKERFIAADLDGDGWPEVVDAYRNPDEPAGTINFDVAHLYRFHGN